MKLLDLKKNWFSFYFRPYGRINRQDFFKFCLVPFLLIEIITLLFFYSKLSALQVSLPVLNFEEIRKYVLIAFFIVIVANIKHYSVFATCAKRLHDFNFSGWWQVLVSLLPLLIFLSANYIFNFITIKEIKNSISSIKFLLNYSDLKSVISAIAPTIKMFWLYSIASIVFQWLFYLALPTATIVKEKYTNVKDIERLTFKGPSNFKKLSTWRKIFFSAKGRMGAAQFNLWSVVILLLMAIIFIVSAILIGKKMPVFLAVIIGVVAAYMLIVLYIKRLHDLNLKGKWLLVIPVIMIGLPLLLLNASEIEQTIVSQIAMTIVQYLITLPYFIQGTLGDNRFGADPRLPLSTTVE